MEKAKQRREKVNEWEPHFVALLFLDVLPDMNDTSLLLLLISAQTDFSAITCREAGGLIINVWSALTHSYFLLDFLSLTEEEAKPKFK